MPVLNLLFCDVNYSNLLLSGTKRFDSEKAGDREVQRTMLELLNQMDGFQPNMQVKVRTLDTSWQTSGFDIRVNVHIQSKL